MKYPFLIRNSGPSNVQSVYCLDLVVDYFDITTVYSGTLRYKIDGIDYTLNKGDTIIIRPGCHCYRYADNNPAHYYALNYYSDGTVESELPDYIPNCSPAFKDITYFVDKISKKMSSPQREAKMSHAISILLLALKEELQNSKYSIHVQQILQYISENYTRPIKLEEIADHVFLTVPYCCHLVKKELGITIYEIILQERILLAKSLLSSGGTPLNEIPFLCGFNDYSHFYKTFKKYTGINPSKYK